MLRIHFTAEDLGKVRLAAQPDPLWEVVLSCHQLHRGQSPLYTPWRRHAGRAADSPAVRRSIAAVAAVNPPSRYFPDFLTPTVDSPAVQDGVDAVLGTPRARLRRELGRLVGVRPPTPWLRDLAGGDRESLGTLGEALLTYHQALVEPYADLIRTRVDTDRAVRARAVLDQGVHGLLASLRPALQWRPPVLEAAFPHDQELHLRGRGIVLVPSYFCWQRPVTMADNDLPPVLVYPALGAQGNAATAGQALGALLGPTRASILRLIGTTDGTTGELARRSEVSPASASEHAKVLREAGLVASVRMANCMVHTVTPLGAALARGR